MPGRLIHCLATTAQFDEIFSDESVLQAMLDFEIALARAGSRLGVIPPAAAEAIAAAGKPMNFDPGALAEAALQSGTPAVAFVNELTKLVHQQDASASTFVHWGATSQDVCDTALALLLKKVRPIFEAILSQMEDALIRLSEQHKQTVMLGRTLLQPAPPVTFGLKAAGWLGAITRSHSRLTTSLENTLILQFGGASGTLAALGDQGLKIAQSLAAELGLSLPDAPWHAHRDRLAGLLCDCGVLAGSLAKMARDIILLAQNEVAEVCEPSAPGRGGSSTMPNKRNPVGCTTAIAATSHVPGFIASFLSNLAQEHERGAGGWQAEWSTVAATISATGLALASMAQVVEGLVVDAQRMRANVESTHGSVFAERAAMILRAKLGREAAHRLLEHASRATLVQGRRLSQVLGEMKEVRDAMGDALLAELEIPEKYLGSAEEFRERLIRSVRQAQAQRRQP